MKLTREMISTALAAAPCEGPQHTACILAGAQAVLDLLDPIPADVVKLYDRGETCWRRSVDDPAVWTTAARSRVATGRVLLDLYGPLKWRDAYGNEDFIVKLTDEKGTNE